jgi:hypothetical protein
VKLTVNGRSYPQPLTVKQDPRVSTSAVNLNRLYTLMRASYVDAADARSALDSARQLREEAAARRAVRPARSRIRPAPSSLRPARRLANWVPPRFSRRRNR